MNTNREWDLVDALTHFLVAAHSTFIGDTYLLLEDLTPHITQVSIQFYHMMISIRLL